MGRVRAARVLRRFRRIDWSVRTGPQGCDLVVRRELVQGSHRRYPGAIALSGMRSNETVLTSYISRWEGLLAEACCYSIGLITGAWPRSISRTVWRALPSKLEPLHAVGFVASESSARRPMPQTVSKGLASARSLSPVSSKCCCMCGFCRNS